MRILEKLFILTAAVLLASVSFSSCTQDALFDDPALEKEALESISAPGEDEGMIAFLSGQVSVKAGSSWDQAAIGDTVAANNRIRTGAASFCELLFGDHTVVRIEEKTILHLKTVTASENKVKVDAGLDAGSILCKVKRLGPEGEFAVQTPSVVVGVRGTEFYVRASEDGSLEAAVREGSLRIYPAALHPEKAETELPDADRVTSLFAEKLREKGIEIPAGEEIRIDREAGEELRKKNREIEEILDTVKDERLEGETAISELSSSLETAGDTLAQVSKKTPLSDENLRVLKKLDDVEGLALSKGVSNFVRLAITSDPESASVTLNGKKRGVTPYAGVFGAGKEVTFELEKEGFVPKRFSLTTEGGEDMIINVTLKEGDAVEEEKAAAAEPAEEIPEEPVPEPPEEVIKEEVEESVLEKRIELQVDVEPGDAEVLRDGKVVGRGGFAGIFSPGDTVELVFRHELYEKKKEVVELGEEDRRVAVSLELKPVVRTFPVFEAGVASVQTLGRDIFLMDTAGNAALVTAEGEIISKFSTGIAPSREGYPALHQGKVFQVGNGRLVVGDVEEGAVLFEQEVGMNEQFSFGRRVVILEGKGIFPGAGSITFFDLETGEILDDVHIAQGMRMVPVSVGENIVTVNRKGQILVLDSKGEYEDILPTTVLGGGNIFCCCDTPRIYAVDDKGFAVCADIEEGRLIWESGKVPIAGKEPAHYSIEIGEKLLYLFEGNDFVPLSLETGETVSQPIGGIPVPPLYHRGNIYACSSKGTLMVLNSETGNLRAETKLQEKISAKPALAGSFIILGTAGGNAVVVNPGAYE